MNLNSSIKCNQTKHVMRAWCYIDVYQPCWRPDINIVYFVETGEENTARKEGGNVSGQRVIKEL